MTQGIIDGICLKLSEIDGEYKIYTEQVKQGLKTPCFFVNCISASQVQRVGNRYRRDYLFAVQFLPGEGDEKEACYNMLNSLFEALEYITVDGELTRGLDMRCEAVDGVLSFFVQYNIFVYYEAQFDAMEEFEQQTNMKE